MNIALWIAQILLALAFATAGVLKTTQPRDTLEQKLPWVEDLSTGTVRFIGSVELLAAIGLILPAVTGIAPVLTPLAATGLALLQALAIATHIRRREPGAVIFNLVLMSVALFVAWGRFGPYAF
jgi:hypothetical protein